MSLEKWSWFLVQVQNEERDRAATTGRKEAFKEILSRFNVSAFGLDGACKPLV